MNHWGKALCGLCLCGFLCWPGALRAQSDEVNRTTARELGREALLALAAHDYAKAEERLDRALSLHIAPTLHLARARARLGLGKLLSAAEDYRAVLRFEASPNEAKSFADARHAARNELDRVEPQFARLTLLAATTPAHVSVNGSAWPAAALGIARPVDPGPYEIVVTSPKGATKTYRILLATGQARELRLEVEQAASSPISPPAAAAASGPNVMTPAPTSKPSAAPATSESHTALYVLGTASVVLIAGSIVSGFVAQNKISQFHRRNDMPEVATSEKEQLRSTASTWAWLNTGLWAAAIVGTGVTGYVYFTRADSDEPRTSVELHWSGRF